MSEQFCGEVGKQAAGRVCAALGFKQAQEPLLEVLADAAHRFVATVAHAASRSAQLGGRSQPGLHDVLSALHHNALPNHWQELRAFAFSEADDAAVWSQPFPGVVPSFPAKPPSHRNQQLRQTPTEADGSRPRSAIPAHLPSFPPPETYQRKRTRAGRQKKDSNLERQKRLKASRQLQQSIAKLSEQDGEEESKDQTEAAATTATSRAAGDQDGVPSLGLREADRPAIGNLLAERSAPATPGAPLTKEHKILEGIVDEEDRDR